ncbi:S9 family peptidase [Telmatocola sphagniphila]|uniref:S9 family peptidase n=1 Tax=Telmatocola sphagniphila TaxID=1123043 RepID=A0A8E6F045_9BACT|nr:S9 family peptidase [Telmatocola sphagniphila]QVL34403.1 S9 family peptidase [Telmatocola sphagniphila]
MLLRLIVVLIGFASWGQAQQPLAPVATKKPHVFELHGDKISDDYFWLKEKKDPEVIKYLEAENAYTKQLTKDNEKLENQLYKDMLSHIKQTDLGVPYEDHGYWYYSRTQEGKQYPINCRKKGTQEAPEQVILDINELAQGKKFMNVGGMQVCDSGNYLAFLTDTTGFREYFLSIKDLESGKLLEDHTIQVSGLEWAADNRTLFYVTEDAAKRPSKLWRHTVGQPKSADQLIYEEKDELFRVGIGRSHDRKYLYRLSRSSTTTEQAYLPSDDLSQPWKIILPRSEGHEYTADHRNGLFYIVTNSGGATNFKISTVPVGQKDAEYPLSAWKNFLTYNPAVNITRILLLKNFLVISEREKGIPHLRVYSFHAEQAYRISFPEPVYSASLGMNAEFDTDAIQLNYTSLVTPASIYSFDLTTQKRTLLKQMEVPGYKSSEYVSERIEATSHDGTKVPISLVYKKGVKRDGSAPCLLYGYGSYGATIPVGFSPARLAMLDRGVIYAEAHIRGGSDLGRQWYLDGKMLNKKNTFLDFIACADHLVKEKYCSRDRLAIQGGSAGGLLVGATINIRPDLCKVAVLQVPFVDVINTMLDESLPLTIQEFLEWGNPKKSEEYEYMKSYCPYTNLGKKSYPSIIVTTSLNDSQVLFHEPTKYVAKLRTLKTDSNPLIFKCNMNAGHGGASGRYEALKEKAFIDAFVLKQLGIND